MWVYESVGLQSLETAGLCNFEGRRMYQGRLFVF